MNGILGRFEVCIYITSDSYWQIVSTCADKLTYCASSTSYRSMLDRLPEPWRPTQKGNYFTSGILLSQDQGSFSQSSLFLSFLMDKAWVLPRPVYGQSRGVPGVSTFFETRLTSVPVTAQPCPKDNTTTTGQCTGTNSDNTDQFNTFLTSQKSARLAVGAYLPFIAKVWS